jgi:hypothetical protein
MFGLRKIKHFKLGNLELNLFYLLSNQIHVLNKAVTNI